MSDIVETVKQTIVDGDDDEAVTQIEKALTEGIDPVKVLKEAIVPGIERAGELWHDNVYFMPDVVLSAEAFKAAMKAVEPHLAGREITKLGTVIMGVVAGDMHDLGKSIVIAMLTGAGF
jgi:trimethylamine corrinoid protein